MDTKKVKSSEEHILSSVKNALRILNSFSTENPAKRIIDLAKELKLGKSTVSRLMATLASEGFVMKDPDKREYRLGLRILTLSGIITANMEMNTEANPVLNKLVQQVGETAHLTILDENESNHLIYLAKVKSNHPVQILSHVGRINPAHATSAGKVLLAHASRDVINRIKEKGLKKYTDQTITSMDEFEALLKDVRRQGYAVSFEELLEGVCSIAAPIYDHTNKVVAAVNIVGPIQRMGKSKIPSYSVKVIQAANDISYRLGYMEKINNL